MEDENLTKNFSKIIKINQNLQKNEEKTPNFVSNFKNIKKIDEDYIMLGETQKFKFTLNYVIKLLRAKMISVDDAINLLMNLI